MHQCHCQPLVSVLVLGLGMLESSCSRSTQEELQAHQVGANLTEPYITVRPQWERLLSTGLRSVRIHIPRNSDLDSADGWILSRRRQENTVSAPTGSATSLKIGGETELTFPSRQDICTVIVRLQVRSQGPKLLAYEFYSPRTKDESRHLIMIP